MCVLLLNKVSYDQYLLSVITNLLQYMYLDDITVQELAELYRSGASTGMIVTCFL